VLVLGSGRSNETDATPHRASRDFLYLTGIGDADCTILVTRTRELLFARARDKSREIWTGEHVFPSEETARRFGFDGASPTTALKQAVQEAVAGATGKIFAGGLSDADKKEWFSEGSKLESPGAAIARLRQVKDPAELALLKRAAEISATAHIYCARAIAPGRFEYEVQGLFEGACRFFGAEAQGYPSIVGSGPNSCILHYDKNRRLMKAGDLLVLDAAGECGGYSADVTRTFPVSGTFTAEQRRVYDAVLKAQDAGIQACRPGTTIGEINAICRGVLKEEGLGSYLPHGVSHWLGLDVHDPGDYALALAPGMVLTVEPGCYIAEKELGVRIEDDILVTEDGPVNLSGHAPRSADAIETLLAQSRAGRVDFPALPEATPVPELRRHKGRLY
jgi:Xaa-Pro aminopeptidase